MILLPSCVILKTNTIKWETKVTYLFHELISIPQDWLSLLQDSNSSYDQLFYKKNDNEKIQLFSKQHINSTKQYSQIKITLTTIDDV